jgi:hypothetical protein
MISRFFKKKTKAPELQKAASSKAKEESSEKGQKSPSQPKKLLTAEGWKRMMMRKTGKKK